MKITIEIEAKTSGNMTAPNMIITAHQEHPDKVGIEIRDRFPKVIVKGEDLITAIKKCMREE